MKLTDNFSLAELTKSQTAERCGFDNNPDKEHIDNLQKLCDNILQPVRDYFQKPVMISFWVIVTSSKYAKNWFFN